MPITRSAKKALRQSLTRRVQNLERKEAFRNYVKQVKKLVAEKNIKEALAVLPKTYQAIDKAAKNGVIKKNTAARTKSRLMKFLKRASA